MDEHLSLSIVPYKPKQIPDSTNLNRAPNNWLRPVGSSIKPPRTKEKRNRKTKMKSSIVANHYLKSHFTSNQKTLCGVNAVANAQTIKNLIKLGNSSENVSMMIHKVGDSLFLDDFDVKTELLDKNSSTHKWFKSILTNILCKGKHK